MAERRMLTDDEKRRIAMHARQSGEARFPGAQLQIIVEDEIDEHGQVHWRTVAMKEAIIPDEPS